VRTTSVIDDLALKVERYICGVVRSSSPDCAHRPADDRDHGLKNAEGSPHLPPGQSCRAIVSLMTATGAACAIKVRGTAAARTIE
jgi:hypothetical protein